jgi:Zn-finger nucleic acid-binding protein
LNKRVSQDRRVVPHQRCGVELAAIKRFAVELHFCCICGAVLGGDFEDEINGEGWGRDICGNCNRTKNDEALFGR